MSGDLYLVEQVVAVLELEAEPPHVLELVATGMPGKDAPALTPLPFQRNGPLEVKAGDQPFYVDYAGTLTGLRASVVDPPTGDGVSVEVVHNGLVVGTAVIADGERTSGFVPTPGVTLAVDDTLTLDVVGVGSTTPGSNLLVALWMKVT